MGTRLDDYLYGASWFEAKSYLDSLINFEREKAHPDELNLERMRDLLFELGNPQNRLRIIHVAGTKGKGSTCAVLESILRACGWRTGLFISPHIENVRERFILNGHVVSEDRLAELINVVRKAAKNCHKMAPTFFELATAVAFLLFEQDLVDWVLLETGLGGRLDSTNVCLPVATVITAIGLDHTQILGNSLAEIAFEKAGIIKPGIPLISGVSQWECRQVIRGIANQNCSPVWELGVDIYCDIESCRANESFWDGIRFNVITPVRKWPDLYLGLAGAHQARNAALVLGLIDQLSLRGSNFSLNGISSGLKNIRWHGRVESICKSPWILMDAAHNPASIYVLVEMLKVWPVYGKRVLLFAVSRDKAVGEMIGLLESCFDEIHLTRYSTGQRALNPQLIAESVSGEFRHKVVVHENPKTATNRILKSLKQLDGLCVAGSIFLLGECRKTLLGWCENQIQLFNNDG